MDPSQSTNELPKENIIRPPPPFVDASQKSGELTKKSSTLTAKKSKQDSRASTLYYHIEANKVGNVTMVENIATILSFIVVLILFPFSLFFVFVVVRHYERAVILRNGKVQNNHAYGPGLVFYLPCIDVIKFTDLRIITYSVPPQEALTQDSLTVTVDAVVFYKICNPIWAVINIDDYKVATHFLAATTLRNAIGTRKLTELLASRPEVSNQIFKQMKHLTGQWGVEINKVEIKDISLPIQLQKAMAAEAESSRLANAKIIVAKAEIESSKSLQLATTLLMDNPLCMQLRYLQSLHMIAGEETHTIVFPWSVKALKDVFK